MTDSIFVVVVFLSSASGPKKSSSCPTSTYDYFLEIFMIFLDFLVGGLLIFMVFEGTKRAKQIN